MIQKCSKMLCNCNELAQKFLHIKRNGDKVSKVMVYKCERLASEVTTKKKKCDFYKEELVSEKKYEHVVEEKKEYEVYKKDYRKEIYRYIDLWEQFGPNPNYISNIVHILSVLGYKYIYNEDLDSLKKRLSGNPDKVQIKQLELPIKLLDVPDHAKIKKTNKIKKTKKKKNTLDIIEIVSESEEEAESEDLDEEDNRFDIDFIDSDNDQDDYDSGGYFSD